MSYCQFCDGSGVTATLLAGGDVAHEACRACGGRRGEGAMTEAEWLASEDPAAMLAFLLDTHPRSGAPWAGMPTARKFRLFACACCRAVWDLLADERSRRAVEVAERYADGVPTLETMDDARGLSYAAFAGGVTTGRNLAAWMAWVACAVKAADIPTPWMRECATLPVTPAAQAAILRGIVGDPFRPVTLDDIDRGTREWCEAYSMALAAYGERGTPCPGNAAGPCCQTKLCPVCNGACRTGGTLDPARLAVLSDAMEEAGCADGGILNHLRSRCPACTDRSGFVWGKVAGCRTCDGTGESTAPRYRGDWALDLVLGKE